MEENTSRSLFIWRRSKAIMRSEHKRLVVNSKYIVVLVGVSARRVRVGVGVIGVSKRVVLGYL